jgi:hypothetical protein
MVKTPHQPSLRTDAIHDRSYFTGAPRCFGHWQYSASQNGGRGERLKAPGNCLTPCAHLVDNLGLHDCADNGTSGEGSPKAR